MPTLPSFMQNMIKKIISSDKFVCFLNHSKSRFMHLEKDFLICGLTGWCLEILYTSLDSLRRKDFRLMGNTSIWMFPIYGTAAAISFIYPKIRSLPAILRSGIYGIGILSGEYLSGSILKHFHSCPWDYSKAKLNIHGLIRLDYLPLWMGAGLLYERILKYVDKLERV